MRYDNTQIVHNQIGNLEFIQFKALLKYEDKIQHAFTLKHGGYSSNNFSTLNLGLNVGDDIDVVKENYKLVCDRLNLNYENLFRGVQIHSDIVQYVNSKNCGTVNKDIDIECDGSITDIPNIPLVTNSADCMTVLIYDVKNNCISCIHCGWQGLLNKIVTKAIKRLEKEFNSNVKNLIVCVCPSICFRCFEVKEDVKQMFENAFNYDNTIIKKDEQHYMIDLQSILFFELFNLGILNENLHFAGICNKCNSNDFFSYRENQNTGRMGCFIMLK